MSSGKNWRRHGAKDEKRSYGGWKNEDDTINRSYSNKASYLQKERPPPGLVSLILSSQITAFSKFLKKAGRPPKWCADKRYLYSSSA